jgi:branched-chain amino acid transport system substrate-binding protein
MPGVHKLKAVSIGLVVAVLVGLTAVGAGATTTGRRAQAAKPASVDIGIIYNKDEAAGQSNEQVETSLRAAIKAGQKRGDLGGAKVVVHVCTNSTNDPNGGAKCANEMASNPKIVAVVGSANSEGATISPILEQAGIAAIGSLPISIPDFTSPIAFPVMSGALGTPGAATLLVDEYKVDKIALGNLDLAAAAQVPILVNQGLSTRGLKLAGEVKLPIEKQDLSAEVAQLGDLGDGIVIASLPEQFARLVQSAKSTGAWDGKKISTLPSILTPAVLKSLGADATGIYIATGGLATTDVKAPGVKRYVREMKKYGNAEDDQDDLVKNAWLAYQVFVAGVKGAPTIDRASVLAGMQKLNYDPQGMAPQLDYTTPNTTVFGGAVPRAFNTSVMYAKVKKGGKIVALSPEFVNPFVAP